jgi:RNA polymerase sigma factor (TIGR02999 family)
VFPLPAVGGTLVADANPSDVTRLIEAVSSGKSGATDDLLPLVYDELRQLAQARMRSERPGHTLGATGLVHEAYLRLLGDEDELKWDSRGHFFGAAARAMRHILIDRARRKGAVKHGGGRYRIDLDALDPAKDEDTIAAIPELDVVLTKLEEVDPRKAEIVMLRFFAGLTIQETALAMGISKTVVKDEWKFARAWLYTEMSANE